MEVFTTGQVAKICKVSPGTVSKWFDSGKLTGYRLPGSLDRRIPREDLNSFLKKNGMRFEELRGAQPIGVLVVSTDDEIKNSLVQADSDLRLKLTTAKNLFLAGFCAQNDQLNCVVIDTCSMREYSKTLVEEFRRNRSDVVLIGIVNIESVSLEQTGFTETFRTPFDWQLLIERIIRLVSRRR